MTGFMRFRKIYMYTYQLKMFYICHLFHSKALKSSNKILGKDEVFLLLEGARRLARTMVRESACTRST